MAWFKVDDTFAMHEKVMAAGNAAIGLWARAGAWSMQQLTDGFVPDHVLRALGTPKERRTLVEVSLWDEVEGGVTFRNWSERQPTKAQVETARLAAAERQRHARERAKSRRDSQRDSQGSNNVSHGPPDPTRPDPTRSSYGTTPPSEGPDKPPPSRKRAAQLSPDWSPNDAHRSIAAERLVHIDEEVAKFRDWAASKGETKKDWDAAFRNWLRNARPTQERPSATVHRLPRADELEEPPSGLSPQEYHAWEQAQLAKRGRR